MKTTFDLPDPLLDQIRAIAAARNTTVKALIEQGMRKVIAEAGQPVQPFKLKDCSVGGNGLSPFARGLSMSQLIELSYEGSGLKTNTSVSQ
jgi:hypothetical protein